MAAERDPERALATLRAWAKEFPRQPIITVYFPATPTAEAEWAFQQRGRDEFLAVPEETIEQLQSRGLLAIRRNAIDGTWRAHLD